MDRLKNLCWKLFKSKGLKDELIPRLEKELREISKQNEFEYFLDLYDREVKYPKNQNNLLVAYVLGIVDDFDATHDVVHTYGEFPDIDVDYIDEVRDYLKNDWAPRTFGRDKVCNIASYGTYAMRSSLLDIAKLFGIDRQEALVVTKSLPNKDEEGDAITWDHALIMDPALKEFCDKNPEVYDAAKRLSESPYGKRNKNMGKHAGGLIISSNPLDDFIPLVVDSDGLVTSAWTEGQHAQELGPLGYIKFDCLTVSNLKQISYICHLIKSRHNLPSICAIPGKKDWSDTSYLDDAKALEMANKGDLKCIFQFAANPGIRHLARDGGVTSFEDLVAYTCVFRPGPLSMGMDKLYVKRKRGEEVYRLHPLMEPIVGKTYGVMVYQEQVIKILNAIGDIPLADCEKVRKAISKKKTEVFAKYKEQFIRVGGEKLKIDCKAELPKNARVIINKLFDPSDSVEINEARIADYAFSEGLESPYEQAMGCVALLYKNKYPDREKPNRDYLAGVASKANARFLWEQIDAFAGYGFNRSHAVAYTYISSRLLWLKAHYPLEFYAGILTFETKEDKLKEYKTEALVHGIKINRIDINKSCVRFCIHQEGEEPSDKDEIYFGLANIKGIGDEIADKIVQNRPYDRFDDFLMKFGTEAKVIKPLLALGIFSDDVPENLYMYYEDFKTASKGRIDRARRYKAKMEEYDAELKELAQGRDIDWNTNMDQWKELDIDEYTEQLCVKPGPKYGSIIRKRFNRYDKITGLIKKRKTVIEEFILKEKDSDENPFTLDKFKPELSQVLVPLEMRELFASKEVAENKYFGFRWDHPLEKSPDFTGKTFNQLKDDDGDEVAGPVEVLLLEWKKREWKNGNGFSYVLNVEDANGERTSVTVWPDDWERFEEDFTNHNLFRLRVQPPTKFGYTLDGPPKWKRHTLPPRDKDYRVVKLRGIKSE